MNMPGLPECVQLQAVMESPEQAVTDLDSDGIKKNVPLIVGSLLNITWQAT